MSSAILMLVLIASMISGRNIEYGVPELYLFEFQYAGEQIDPAQEKIKYKYVGAKACVGRCHNSEESGYQYKKWQNSRHAGSFLSLSSEKAFIYAQRAGVKGDPGESLTCLKCHITGADLDPVSFGSTYTKKEGVTCEACHKDEFITYTLWKGNSRVVNNKDLQPDEKTCLRCHNNHVHKTGRFNYNSMYRKISHTRTAM